MQKRTVKFQSLANWPKLYFIHRWLYPSFYVFSIFSCVGSRGGDGLLPPPVHVQISSSGGTRPSCKSCKCPKKNVFEINFCWSYKLWTKSFLPIRYIQIFPVFDSQENTPKNRKKPLIVQDTKRICISHIQKERF